MRLLYSTIKKSKIMESTYEELTNAMAKKYKNSEHRHPNAACLYEIQQQYRLCKPGDWVLDIGAGPNYYWTDLALQFTDNPQKTNKVISNDILEVSKKRPGNKFIIGDFTLQNVQTNIALELQDHLLDAILVDVSPQYSGNVNKDGRGISNIATEVLQFAEFFLKVGGNMVCKLLECESEKPTVDYFQTMFKQCHKFVPAVVRKNSPVCFYVLKGYHTSQDYRALVEFLQRYRGGTERRKGVVKEYKNKFKWDPVEIIRNRARNNIVSMYNQKIPIPEIRRKYEVDPYVDTEKIIKQIEEVEEAKKGHHPIALVSALRQLSCKTMYSQLDQLPLTQEQYLNYLETELKKVSTVNEKAKANPGYPELLKENQIYMKTTPTSSPKIVKSYTVNDLIGEYKQEEYLQDLQLQLRKLQQAFPELKNEIDQISKLQKKDNKVDLQQFFDSNIMTQEQQKELHILEGKILSGLTHDPQNNYKENKPDPEFNNQKVSKSEYLSHKDRY